MGIVVGDNSSIYVSIFTPLLIMIIVTIKTSTTPTAAALFIMYIVTPTTYCLSCIIFIAIVPLSRRIFVDIVVTSINSISTIGRDITNSITAAAAAAVATTGGR